MAHTPEQRDRHPLCGARKKSGEPCRKFAGEGTDHPGVGRCRYHLGSTPNHKKHAVAVEAKARLVKLGQPIRDIRPTQALLGLLRATAGHVAFLHTEIGALEDLSAHEAQVILRLYDEERDRLARIGEACVRAGVSLEEVRVSEREIQILGTALRRAAETAGLDHAQQQKLGAALRTELETVTAADDDPSSIYSTA